MALFRRKKIESPRNPLGLALYQYDNILKKDLKKILHGIEVKKKLNEGKAGLIVDNANDKFDNILESLSKKKLKVDYRSDKIRYEIINMIKKLKNILKEAKKSGFEPSGVAKNSKSPGIDELREIRAVIKNKMKDIESDYI
jgi:hypothetical protein